MKQGKKKGTTILIAAVTLVVAAAFAACQSGPPQIAIENARAELSPAIVGEAMVTMNITNRGGADTLTGVATDIPGAHVLLHQMQGQRMVEVASMAVPAKGALDFKMGDSHIMIQDMPKTVKQGSQFTLTLTFQKSGERKVPLTLQPASMHMGHDMGGMKM